MKDNNQIDIFFFVVGALGFQRRSPRRPRMSLFSVWFFLVNVVRLGCVGARNELPLEEVVDSLAR